MSNKTKTVATKSDATPALVPKLRFPEFQNAGKWEEKSLEELSASISSGKDQAAPDGAFALYGSTGIIGRTHNNSYNGIFLLVARVGANAGLLTKATGEFGVTDNTLVIILKAEQNTDFILYYLDQIGLSKMVFGSGQPLITGGQLKALRLQLPMPAEQQRIASCLSSLDSLITAHTQKLNALKTYKKGLMQQLFPCEGETVPRLRFPEFENAGEWAKKKLGEVANLRNGYAFKSTEYVDSGAYTIITIANVQQGILALDSTKSIAALPSDIQLHQVLSPGDILISMTGNVGRICRVNAEGLLLNQRVGKLTPTAIDDSFFYQQLQRDEFRNTMQLKAAGGAQGNLSGGDIAEYGFTMPTEPDEQQRIADWLSTLDDLIAAQTQMLEALKTHKKGLMQGLFPSREAMGS